jgi:hypothetical protein
MGLEHNAFVLPKGPKVVGHREHQLIAGQCHIFIGLRLPLAASNSPTNQHYLTASELDRFTLPRGRQPEDIST